jgi:ABC-2 type transport system permease protein
MGKIGIIIRREYLTRVRNKTFIIMCFLAPVLWAALFIVPAIFSSMPSDPRTIVVVDEIASQCGRTIFNYDRMFRDTLNIHFVTKSAKENLSDVRKNYEDSSQVSVLLIPSNFLGACDSTGGGGINMKVELYSQNEPGKQIEGYLGAVFSEAFRERLYQQDSLSIDQVERAKKQVLVTSIIKGRVSNSDVKMIVGLVFGLIIYLYVLLFGAQVMRSVLEEKTTRIVEVIVSSVRPFELMFGKIIATALAGLTQLGLWIILSLLIILPIMSKVNDHRTDYTRAMNKEITAISPGATSPEDVMNNIGKDENVNAMLDTVTSINWPLLIGLFIFYFLFGYFMYASIFAAIGAASDTETDTQQFMVPVTIPLIISIASWSLLMNNPDGTILKWLSQIPLTSPVVMLMRIPFNNVGIGELLLSMFILISSFIAFTWMAGRIYRVGILMYGKKASWRELGRWLFYKS